jgi:hypothetical protein
MSIVVYWASFENEWMRCEPPTPIYPEFIKKSNPLKNNLKSCPSIKSYLKNYFSLKSIYNYEFTLDDNTKKINTDMYDQSFFDKHVNVRSFEEKIFSFSQYTIFFTEEKSLKLSSGIFPFFENNNITKNCMPIPGTVDIGKWFRVLDYGFFLKEDIFKIEENEIYSYLKFDTEEKIIFKQFEINDKLHQYINDVLKVKENRIEKFRTLQEYYSTMKNKKNIIKEIKNNLI